MKQINDILRKLLQNNRKFDRDILKFIVKNIFKEDVQYNVYLLLYMNMF